MLTITGKRKKNKVSLSFHISDGLRGKKGLQEIKNTKETLKKSY